MRKLQKAIRYLAKRKDITTIVSAISLIACITMIVILGTVSAICATIESILKEKMNSKRGE